MGVDYYWRRVAEADVRGLGAAELSDLVPYWFDDLFERESQAGITLGTTDTAALMDELLRLGAGDGPDAEAAWLSDTAREVGYHRPFDDDWAQTLVDDAEELTALFVRAAKAEEAVIVKVVA